MGGGFDMGKLSKRFTVYFEPEIHQALRVKAASVHLSLSEVVNEAVRIINARGS